MPLGELIYESIIKPILEFWDTANKTIGKFIIDQWKEFTDALFDIVWSKIDEILAEAGIPPAIRIRLREMIEGSEYGVAGLGAGLGIEMGQGILSAFLRPIFTAIEQKMWELMPFRIPDPATALELYRRQLISEGLFKLWCRKQGLDEGIASNLLQLAFFYPTPTELVRWYKKGFIREDEFYEEMRKHQIEKPMANTFLKDYEYIPSPETILRMAFKGIIPIAQAYQILDKIGIKKELAEKYFTDYWFIPSIPDLIRFAVREAYRDDIAAKYGYDEEFPITLVEIGRKIGLKEEYAKYYWRAHWELPSLTQGYEMLHRDVISKEDLETLLKIADIPSWWRDKLIKISYYPFTRVDVRRMYGMGVLTKEEVLRAYKDLGYDDWHAEKLTEFTINFERQRERDLTRSQIKKLYEIAEIDRQTAKRFLVEMGYSEEEAEYILSIWDNDILEDELKDYIGVLTDQLLLGKITWTQFEDLINRLGLPATRLLKIKTKVQRKLDAKIREPSKEDIFAFFKLGLIDETKCRELLKLLGFTDNIINLYMQKLKIEIGA